MEMVVSILRRRVLGLVLVVPRLACRAWPRLNGVPVGEVGVTGDRGDAGELGIEAPLMANSRFEARPVGEMGAP
jgi:hypothetical protein